MPPPALRGRGEERGRTSAGVVPTLRPMKVTELVAYVVRVPLKKRIKHASHARTETDNVLVRARLNDGSVGWGEGVPREYVTGESADSALDLLKETDLKAQLGECRDFIGALRVVEALK